jgi:hypothetical protein
MDDANTTAAEGYRSRALEVRAKAAQMNDPSLREMMLRIARDYERMANVLKNLGEILEAPPCNDR